MNQNCDFQKYIFLHIFTSCSMLAGLALTIRTRARYLVPFSLGVNDAKPEAGPG